jgi:FixJ family two-component response regulator
MNTRLPSGEPTVFVVDLDATVYHALRTLARPRGVPVEFYVSADEYFQTSNPAQLGCLFTDPDPLVWGGSHPFVTLIQHRIHLPVVVVSTRGDIPMVVRAMQAGARDYVQKPCDEGRLAAALQDALHWDAENHQRILDRLKVQRRLSRLTNGEREVLQFILVGMANKGIADQLGLSVRTIEVRRAKIMGKMKTHSLAELVCHAVSALLVENGDPPIGGHL